MKILNHIITFFKTSYEIHKFKTAVHHIEAHYFSPHKIRHRPITDFAQKQKFRLHTRHEYQARTCSVFYSSSPRIVIYIHARAHIYTKIRPPSSKHSSDRNNLLIVVYMHVASLSLVVLFMPLGKE